ncbi:hypothetical protein PC123_g3518 [Phytophthora cactorum]|nr:hypothetical protein PC123_g3518 [Phytophthora cactorum]
MVETGGGRRGVRKRLPPAGASDDSYSANSMGVYGDDDRGGGNSVVPADYARRIVATREYDDSAPHDLSTLHERDDDSLPLITNADTRPTPSKVSPTTSTVSEARAPGAPPAAGAPPLTATRLAAEPGFTSVTHTAVPTQAVSSTPDLLQAMFQEHRLTNEAFRSQMATAVTALASLQHQVLATLAPAVPHVPQGHGGQPVGRH